MNSHSASNSLESLNEKYKFAAERAIRNIISTDVAEQTYAQILDGLPTEQSLEDSYVWIEGHPVYELKHKEICAGFIEKARHFRDQFNITDLSFEKTLLDAFRSTVPGSKHFHLRLIEITVVACHQIGAYLYELDSGAHPHKLYEDWREREYPQSRNGMHPNGYFLPYTPFVHAYYQFRDQYPRGSADIVGYWAEGQIFGGVIVFERGETETECNAMWIHGARRKGPKTLYPPTEEQFKALVAFLLADSDHLEATPCPLPIHGTKINRPRWGADEAFAEHHIFRDRYERQVSVIRPPRPCVIKDVDWPEHEDHWFLFMQSQARYQGEEVDEEAIAAAQERLKNITPSSPLWRNVYGGSEQNGG